ncbi:unannotated protein [freshwater metagenome]|uniref:Unannotated protein n=1 Tax=freshwater metagenome TaxID=449393 RepID=A0A6J6PWS8_9ZZZZ
MAAVVAATLVACLGLAGCDQEQSAAPLPPPSTQPVKKVALTFGVFGRPYEVSAYKQMVQVYNSLADASTFRVRSWPDRDAFADAVRGGEAPPDVFLASRRDLAWLREEGFTRPVDELLDERAVDFGDGYSRDALEAFSADRQLQCMPYGVSPTVIFYNSDLVDFDAMAARGLDVPAESHAKWTLEEFRAAAEFATRPRKKTRGLAIEPTLSGLAPFIYSGGGSIFDDEVEPTSLSFSSDSTRSALERTLEILRDPHLNLTNRQLEQAPALSWFKRGKVAMIAGDRSLVPSLRLVHGLSFDVMPMPTLETPATVGDLTGLCINPSTASISESADFLVYASSAPAASTVTRTGYLVPANQQVALSDDFLQPGRQPLHAGVFTDSVRDLVLSPLLDSWAELTEAVSSSIRLLVDAPGVLALDEVTERIDEESRTVLSPDDVSDETD